MSPDGDVLYVLRNVMDKDFADAIINTKNVKFRYYPGVDTKSGFDSEKPIEAKSILRKASKKIISTKQKLEQFFIPKPKKHVDIVKVQANNLKTIENVTFIDTAGSNYRTNIDHENGICSVYTMITNPKNKNKKIRHSVITITPPDKFGISYARIIPANNETKKGDMMRLAIKNGEVIFEYNQPGSEIFIKNEAAAKQHYLDLMTKYKEELASFRSTT